MMFLAPLLLLLDRITKWYAVHTSSPSFQVAPCLYFERSFNRGITWSLLSSTDTLYFWALTLGIAGVIAGFMVYTYREYRAKKLICPHTLIIIGAISNLIDRVWYGGVVDFILLSCKGWSWPIFNFADLFIVGGVFALLVMQWRE